MPVALRIEKGPHEGVRRAEVVRRLRVIAGALALDGAEISIVLTNDEQIHILNRDYRGIDRATDVLSFAMREGEFGTICGELLGDVVVSVDTARRQAVEEGRDLTSELTMLLAHGILHLLGWDHDTAPKDRAMRAETDRLCALAASLIEGRPAPRRPPARPPGQRRQRRGG